MSAPDQIPAAFVGAVTQGARLLAERVEQELHRSEKWAGEPRVQVLWMCFLFVLHLTDRVAFIHLSADDRHLFMSRILAILAERFDEDVLRSGYNSAQRQWAQFRELLPEKGKGTRGTLFYEFSKAVCQEFNDMNPAVAISLSLHAANTFEALDDTFQEFERG